MRWRVLALLLLMAIGAGVFLYKPWLTPLQHLLRRTHPSGVKVVLLGIDGASFRVMDPLVAEGKLPNFKRLIDAGVRSPLQSENPMASPALWTTIATGQSREHHGIGGFVTYNDPKHPKRGTLVASTDRKTLALWNIASAFGQRVGFIGWWASWPAEPVNGFMVSDRFTRERWNEWVGGRKQEHRVFPESLTQELAPLIVDPALPPMDEIARLVALTPAEQAELRAASKPVFGHGLSVFKFAYCSQRSYENMALHLLGRAQPDLLGLFLVANDPVSHCFWHFYEPDAFSGVDRQQAERLGALVPNFYVHNDAFLGELLAHLDKDTAVLVVSDHGFEASRQLPALKAAPEMFEGADAERAAMNGMIAVGQSGKHNLAGVLIAAGGPIRRGASVEAGVRDIAPTVLALLGLPIPRDMDGRVLKEMLEPEFLAGHPLVRIPSYEALIDRKAVLAAAGSSVESEEEKKELLRSLGYIQ
jgi:hypothetical protein